MIQQPRSRKYADRKIRQKWSVQPSISHHGHAPLVAVRLGNLATVHIPPRMAMCLADALIDAVETGATTTYENPKSSASREVQNTTLLDTNKDTSNTTQTNHERYT